MADGVPLRAKYDYVRTTQQEAGAHQCHAEGCERTVPPKLLMCGRHWRLVPVAVQRRVWATYRPGQEVTKDPSGEYLRAAKAAIDAVARAEGRR